MTVSPLNRYSAAQPAGYGYGRPYSRFQGTFPNSAPVSAAPTQALNPVSLSAKQGLDTQGRTKGLWAFDTLLYPVLANNAVFLLSLLATYATTYYKRSDAFKGIADIVQKKTDQLIQNNGSKIAAALNPKSVIAHNWYFLQEVARESNLKHHSVREKAGFYLQMGTEQVLDWLKQRGDLAREFVKKQFSKTDAEMAKMGHAEREKAIAQAEKVGKIAKDSIMIGFSFLDGCIMAPFIKLFEDRRGAISRKFDQWMGTTPSDTSVYDREPKQSWGSVLGGRAVSAALVVPTAIFLGQHYKGLANKSLVPARFREASASASKSLNDILFNEPGKALGKAIENNERVKKALPNFDIPGLCEVGLFEGVYTAICTAGLYLSSRFFARNKEAA